jgi:hypothetical protein
VTHSFALVSLCFWRDSSSRTWADRCARLYPSLFTQATERGFQEAFDLSLGKYDPAFLDAVQKLLGLIMLRRTKKTVEFTVPPLEEMVVFLRQSS